jgi:hypothetical protein
MLRAVPERRVRIIGHTDDVGTDELNDPLSRDRAATVRAWLHDHGIAEDRMEVEGRGEHEPVALESLTPGCRQSRTCIRQHNRRVDFGIFEPQTPSGPGSGPGGRAPAGSNPNYRCVCASGVTGANCAAPGAQP